MLKWIKVKKVGEAQGALCLECDTWIPGNAYWDWTKSKHLHQTGTGHKKFELYRLEEIENGK